MNTIVTERGEIQFQPLNDRILVRRLPEAPSFIYIPEVAAENSKVAEVMAIGKKVRDVAVGDIVLLPGVASKYPDWEQSDLMLVQLADIGGIFESDGEAN